MTTETKKTFSFGDLLKKRKGLDDTEHLLDIAYEKYVTLRIEEDRIDIRETTIEKATVVSAVRHENPGILGKKYFTDDLNAYFGGRDEKTGRHRRGEDSAEWSAIKKMPAQTFLAHTGADIAAQYRLLLENIQSLRKKYGAEPDILISVENYFQHLCMLKAADDMEKNKTQ